MIDRPPADCSSRYVFQYRSQNRCHWLLSGNHFAQQFLCEVNVGKVGELAAMQGASSKILRRAPNCIAQLIYANMWILDSLLLSINRLHTPIFATWNSISNINSPPVLNPPSCHPFPGIIGIEAFLLVKPGHSVLHPSVTQFYFACTRKCNLNGNAPNSCQIYIFMNTS